MAEIRETKAPLLTTILKTIREDRKVTLVHFSGLGEVEFSGWETPPQEALEGAKLGLEVQAGNLTYKQALRQANEIDFRYYKKEREGKGLGITREQPETPATNALARVIGGIPPRKRI